MEFEYGITVLNYSWNYLIELYYRIEHNYTTELDYRMVIGPEKLPDLHNVQHQKLPIGASEPSRCNASPQGFPWTFDL